MSRSEWLALGLAAGLTLNSLSQPLMVLAQEPLGDDFRVNTYTMSSHLFPSVGMDADGDFVVVWRSGGQDGSYSGVYAQRYNATGTPQGSEFRVNTYTTDRQDSPSVGMDADGDFVVTWVSQGQDGSDFGIYAQRYNAQGTPQGSEFRVNSYTTDWQGDPSIGMDADGDFVVTWASDNQNGSDGGIYAQRYNAQGTPQGSEFRVNSYTTNSQSYPSIGLDADGDGVSDQTELDAGTDRNDPTDNDTPAKQLATLVKAADSVPDGSPSTAELTAAGVNNVDGGKQAAYEMALADPISVGLPPYADPNNPTLAEVQAVIDAVNSSGTIVYLPLVIKSQ